jgi:hypothetical protein
MDEGVPEGFDPKFFSTHYFNASRRVTINSFLKYERHEILDVGNNNWMLHNEYGPAIISGSREYYWLLGSFISKEDWLIRASKLGKILYG